MFGLTPLSCLLVRNNAEDTGLSSETEVHAEGCADSIPADMPLGPALRTPAFWAVTLATALYGLVWSGITLFNQSILEEHGFGAREFYLVMAVLAGSGMVCNLVTGWLTTRRSMGRSLGIGMLLLAAALIAFPGISSFAGIMLYALVLGAAGGIIAVAYLTIYGYAFGRAYLGQIQGAAQILSIFASALGPVLLTRCKEWTGSYDGMFYCTAPAVALLGIWSWLVPVPRSVPVAYQVHSR
jgi:MFS family permease